MATITIPRSDITTDEVAAALRDGLPAHYNVVPGTGVNNNPLGRPRPNQPDTILVGIGANRWTRAQVRIVRRPRDTDLRITPGGLLGERLVNTFGLAREMRRVLRNAPSLTLR